MNSLTIRTNSVAANLVDSDRKPFYDLSKRLEKKFMEITLFDNKARIQAIATRTRIIPTKALRNSRSLCFWLFEQAEKIYNNEMKRWDTIINKF